MIGHDFNITLTTRLMMCLSVKELLKSAAFTVTTISLVSSLLGHYVNS